MVSGSFLIELSYSYAKILSRSGFVNTFQLRSASAYFTLHVFDYTLAKSNKSFTSSITYRRRNKKVIELDRAGILKSVCVR